MASKPKVFWFFCFGFSLAFAVVSTHWTEPSIPDYIQICHRDDDNFTDCIKSSIELFQKALIDGIPNIDIPSVDPLNVGELFQINHKRHGININVRNVLVMGILKFKIDKLDVMKHGRQYNIRVTFPKMQVEGECDTNGKTKWIAFNESCTFVETFHAAKGKLKIRFTHIPDKWQVQTDQIEAKIKEGKGVVKFYDLTRGRRILDDYDVDNILNDSFNDMNRDMFPVVEKVLGHLLTDIFNKVLGQFSYSQIFPQ